MAEGAPLTTSFGRLNHWEAAFCQRCNRVGQIAGWRRFFATASRLGDGIAWYALLVALPLAGGEAAVGPAAHMTLTALVALVLYKWIKSALGRERPYAVFRSVKALVPALDQYSFPSGHTMHAAVFTVMVAHYYPGLLLVVAPFAISVALSRVVLGLHYPTDVLAGAVLGVIVAAMSLEIIV
jgi:undecaprenyl-diphosphatase